ncbi:MAG: FHA domain-containing serine/threonine-protein kinase [Chloroflexota bacterium]
MLHTQLQKGEDPLIGNIIAGYHILKRLGMGSYGVVYLARHPRIKDRLVALKYLRMSDEYSVATIEREVEILSRLQHPNVINISDTYRFDQYQLIVMELMRGGDLKSVVKALQKPIEVSYALEIVETLGYVLGYVHSQNVVHLDLKPANIMLDPIAGGQQTRTCVTDFGLAKIMQPDGSISSGIVGTPDYMSPEHFGFGDARPDHRSDIYSMGVILYELIVGKVPYDTNQILELLNMHAHAPVPRITDHFPQLPSELDQILEASLAKNPDSRFQTATEMADAIRQIRASYNHDLIAIAGRSTATDIGALVQHNADEMLADQDEYPPPASGAALNLLVMMPTGEQQNVSFTERFAVVGRDQQAALHLPQETISRRHMQIDLDRNGNVFITDLGSVNGTYLDGVRLIPHERTRWNSRQYVQIEGYLLQIQDLAGEEASVVPVASDTQQIVQMLGELDRDRVKPSVHIDISPSVVYLELEKPQYVRLEVHVRNTPTAYYTIHAKPGPGIDDRWYTLPAGHLIQDGETHTFDMLLSMPPTGTTGNTTREIAIEVSSDRAEIPTAYRILKVRVVSYTRYVVALRPNEVSHHRRRRNQVVIRNEGNQQDTFTIEVEAPDTLEVETSRDQVTIPAGETQSVGLRFKPRKRRQMATGRLSYMVSVRTSLGIVQRISGKYVIPSRRRGLNLITLTGWILFVVLATRQLWFGIPVPEQFEQLRDLIQETIGIFME